MCTKLIRAAEPKPHSRSFSHSPVSTFPPPNINTWNKLDLVGVLGVALEKDENARIHNISLVWWRRSNRNAPVGSRAGETPTPSENRRMLVLPQHQAEALQSLSLPRLDNKKSPGAKALAWSSRAGARLARSTAPHHTNTTHSIPSIGVVGARLAAALAASSRVVSVWRTGAGV